MRPCTPIGSRFIPQRRLGLVRLRALTCSPRLPNLPVFVYSAPMAVDWSEGIAIAELADEPALSDELLGLIERVKNAPAVPHVVLNFGQVTYLNSTNIAQLLRLRQGLARHGRRLRLCLVGDQVWSVMMVTGLDKVFSFAPDPMTALAGLQLEDAEGGAA